MFTDFFNLFLNEFIYLNLAIVEFEDKNIASKFINFFNNFLDYNKKNEKMNFLNYIKKIDFSTIS